MPRAFCGQLGPLLIFMEGDRSNSTTTATSHAAALVGVLRPMA